MQNNELSELISATSEVLNLNKSVVEKDFYVTQVIHAISDIENDVFRLVFPVEHV